VALRSADPEHPPPHIPELAEPLPDLDGAACIDHPYLSPDAWTGGAPYADQMLAKAICRACPVLKACRSWALGPSGMNMTGIIGGLSEGDRRQIRRQRQSAEGRVA
jgi:hypothetical protein